jgi:arylsulfatase A-like enzyme
MRRPLGLIVAVLVLVAGVGAFFLFRDDEESPSNEKTSTTHAPSESTYLERACKIPPEWATRVARGYVQGGPRDSDLVIIPAPPGYVGGFESTSHSGPYNFLQHVPLVFYGPGFIEAQGTVTPHEETTLADVAPTYAEMMDFDFPQRQGTPLSSILTETDDSPNLIVSVVIDGGGWNVYKQWPNSYPFMKDLIEKGASISNATVGSSPSVTPSTHTNLSTSAFPDRHGVTGIVVRKNDGSFVGGFTKELDYAGSKTDPSVTLKATTLADEWDKAMGNEPQIATVSFGNYTAGMIGHGADLAGGDKDIAAFEEDEIWATDTRYYSLPPYLNTELPGPEEYVEETDLLDGQSDDLWRGHSIAPLDATPAFAPYVNDAVEAIVSRESMGADELTDLFYINYKSPDMAGHQWNMIRPEQKDVLESVDAALADLVSFLDEQVGNDEYVLLITADHGQTPLEAGGWAVDKAEIIEDVDEAFDKTRNGVGLIERTSPTVMFVKESELEANDVTPEKLASYLTQYTIEENVGRRDGDEIPPGFRNRAGDPVFSAVYPGGRIPEVLECTGATG